MNVIVSPINAHTDHAAGQIAAILMRSFHANPTSLISSGHNARLKEPDQSAFA
jgi:hypothetical protein